MARLGRRQQLILQALEEHPAIYVRDLCAPDAPKKEKTATCRAARRLADLGLIALSYVGRQHERGGLLPNGGGARPPSNLQVAHAISRRDYSHSDEMSRYGNMSLRHVEPRPGKQVFTELLMPVLVASRIGYVVSGRADVTKLPPPR